MNKFFNVFFDNGDSFIWEAKSKEQIYSNCGKSYFVSGGKWRFPKPLIVAEI